MDTFVGTSSCLSYPEMKNASHGEWGEVRQSRRSGAPGAPTKVSPLFKSSRRNKLTAKLAAAQLGLGSVFPCFVVCYVRDGVLHSRGLGLLSL